MKKKKDGIYFFENNSFTVALYFDMLLLIHSQIRNYETAWRSV